MKGFVLKINGKCISGSIKEGITSIILTCKENQCHVHFGSLDKSGMFSCTWYSADLKTGDCLKIRLEDIISISEIKEIRDYNRSLEESQKENLDLYRRLKKELIEEGLISE